MGPGTIWNRRLEKAAQRINTELDKIEDDKDEVNLKRQLNGLSVTFCAKDNNCDFETYSASLLNETLLFLHTIHLTCFSQYH